MKEIILKWGNECKRCGRTLTAGENAMYEKSMGVFCLGHEPKEIEEIRAYRQDRADKKAARLEEWAEKRKEKAAAALNSYPTLRHDWAFITQPGHIPLRARMIAADDRAFESLAIAEKLQEKANNLRRVRVAGDAERRREIIRANMDKVIKKGSRVYDFCFGAGEVVGIYAKSYRIKFDTGGTYSRDKSYVKPLT